MLGGDGGCDCDRDNPVVVVVPGRGKRARRRRAASSRLPMRACWDAQCARSLADSASACAKCRRALGGS